MIQLLALMLTVPPVPPPPADRYAAAEKLLHVVPLAPGLKTQVRDRAVSGYSYSVTRGSKSEDYDRRQKIELLVSRRIAGDDKFNADFNGCMTQAIGWRYDLPMLNDIAKVVETPGGKVLWSENIIPIAEKCFSDTIPTFLQYTGFESALRWYATSQLNGALPSYDSAKSGPAAFGPALIAYCGPSTRDALVHRGDKLGISGSWASKSRNRAAEICLVQSARLFGYDLPVFQADGSTVIVITVS